jgi:DNA-binding CsgD family transcriptional regulator
LVRGEAGVGKTALVEEACRAAGDRADAVWAACLPLTSMTMPLLPLRAALRKAGLGTDISLADFDAWLDRLAANRAVVLVVDDLQWADQSSLDVLLYAVAGRSDRGLAVVATVRAGTEDERLLGWLADVRRLPRVRELILDRLDRAATGEQIAAILGRPADERLVDEVYVRTGGNPYLTRLLVQDVDPRAAALPASRPARLRDAVIRPWRRMSPAAREVTRIVAVGGHPQSYDRLTKIAPALGLGAPVLPALSETVDAGVLRAAPDALYWFTHPLLAEILEGDLLPEQRRDMHASYASVLGDRDPAALADHYHRAGMTEPAFRWALRAADATTGPAERLRLCRRAASLWTELENPEVRRAEVWERLRAAAHDAGRTPDELEAVEALIGLRPEPLRLRRLALRRAGLRFDMGIDGPDVGIWRAVVAFTAAFPDSAEHAIATAELAGALVEAEDPEGFGFSAAAMDLAKACGSEEAIASALIPAAYAKFQAGEAGAAEDAARAWEIGSRLHDFGIFKWAVYATANVLPRASSRDTAAVFRRAAEELTTIGAPHSHVAEMCACEASALLSAGEWAECRQRLRVALGARPGPRGEVVARLTAASLACLQGRRAEAEGHVARAEEVFSEHAGGLWLVNFDETRARVALAGRDPEAAYGIARHELDRGAYVEDMLPIAAQALADRADACRDTGEDPAPVLAMLADLSRRYPAVTADSGQVLPAALKSALQAHADAERARATRHPGELALWRTAADSYREAEMPWYEAYARCRQARATLRDRRTHRQASEALRCAHRLATRLGAEGMLADLERLAVTARIDLTEPDRPAAPPPDMPGLTGREREVLGHLLAGETNAQIAKALVLSEKTISVHISNMLRKTGTANRVELAELAHRQMRPRI